MRQYKISESAQPAHQYLQIEVTFPSDKDLLKFYLPSWRPGRYEFGNFAKNVKGLKVYDAQNKQIDFYKIDKTTWQVNTEGTDKVTVCYSYYANELNAGSTFLSDDLFYFNPVNCLICEEGREEEPIEVLLEYNDNFTCVTGLKHIGDNHYHAESFHELVDCPVIASNQVQGEKFESHGVEFNVWFIGEAKIDWDKVLRDFKKFTDFQIEKFKDFPAAEFHYINIIDTKQVYHGVEHLNNTMIYLGPSYDVMDRLYTELLGVSSHELYHVWNIKTIRPAEMQPYNYTTENYTHLGYVAEGVTTYMGDRILFESGVFDEKQYHKELGNYITRHYHNDGRKHYSVAESSFDTWLDGYVAGAPGRKTSIYVEGCLIAYICDMRIRQNTNNEKSLHDVMLRLYEDVNEFYTGYTANDYFRTLEEIGETSFTDLREKLFYGTEDYTPFLEEALAFENFKLVVEESKNQLARLGLLGTELNGGFKVAKVKEGSAAYKAGLTVGDVISTINHIKINKDLEKWAKYFENDPINLRVIRYNKEISAYIGSFNKEQFYSYTIKADS